MVLVYYDHAKEKVYICSEESEMKCVSATDSNLLDYIPNDSILYVQAAHIVSKQQFTDWMNGDLKLEDIQVNQDDYNQPARKTVSSNVNRKYIHPRNNGGVTVESIRTEKYPEGLVMMSKWDFIPLDTIGGEEVLDSDVFLRMLLQRKKIEVVDHQYILDNAHQIKKSLQQTPSDRALDRIIVKDGRPGMASRIAETGGLGIDDDYDFNGSGAIPVNII